MNVSLLDPSLVAKIVKQLYDRCEHFESSGQNHLLYTVGPDTHYNYGVAYATWCIHVFVAPRRQNKNGNAMRSSAHRALLQSCS